MAMGMQPLCCLLYQDGKETKVILFPYATLKFKKYGTSIPLVISQANIDPTEQLNKSAENLEYNFASNIKSIIAEERKNVCFW